MSLSRVPNSWRTIFGRPVLPLVKSMSARSSGRQGENAGTGPPRGRRSAWPSRTVTPGTALASSRPRSALSASVTSTPAFVARSTSACRSAGRDSASDLGFIERTCTTAAPSRCAAYRVVSIIGWFGSVKMATMSPAATQARRSAAAASATEPANSAAVMALSRQRSTTRSVWSVIARRIPCA